MPDYTLTQTAATVDATLVKSATYIPKSMVTVADITARNAIATADKENGKVVRVLDDGSGNVAYYAWNSSGSSWDEAYFPVDPDLYDQIYTPTYSSDATVTQEITSLLSTALKSRLDAIFYGNTTSNLLTDTIAGCESITGWTTSFITVAVDSSNEFEGTNCLKITLTSTSGEMYRDEFDKISTSKYYLVSAYLKNGDLSGEGIRIRLNNVGGTSVDMYSDYVTSNNWTRVGIVVSPTDFGSATAMFIRPIVAGAIGEFAFVDALQINEITSADYTLGASAMLAKYPYHRGLKSSEYSRIKSVGKNLFDGEIELGSISTVDGSLVVSTTKTRSKNKIYLDESTQYTIKHHTTNIQKFIIFYTGNDEFISVANSTSTNPYTFTTPANLAYAKLRIEGSSFEQTIQLEKGTSATDYESYTETSACAPISLHSVSNGTQCTFNLNTGLHTQKIRKRAIQSADIVVHSTVGTNNDVFRMEYTDMTSVGTILIDGKVMFEDLRSETIDADQDLIISRGKFYTANNQRIYLIYAKGTALATVQAKLDGMYILYELAAPVETQYYPNTLTAEQSGTIYVEPFIEDYDFYDSGCVITNTSYPINLLSYVNIVDKTTGVLTPVSLSTCTVASDGLSFTSTAISDEDLVDFGYSHKYLSTIPTLEYSYNENLSAVVISNREDMAELDRKIEQVIVQEKSRLNVATVTLGAISATTTFCAFIAPMACDIVKIEIVTKDAISANDTDYWTIEAIDKGSAGSDSNTIVSKTTKVTGGTAVSAYDAYNLGTLDGTHSKLTAGDVVLLTFTKSASATAFAEAMAMITYMTGN